MADPTLRTQTEVEAERALRRGEFKVALALYKEALAARPHDPALEAKIASIQSLAQPDELERGGAPVAQPSMRSERPPTLEQQAEMLLERGDYQAALATYERVLGARPGHQLARERLEEIRRLVAMNPQNAPEPQLPADTDGILQALLVRIAARRKA